MLVDGPLLGKLIRGHEVHSPEGVAVLPRTHKPFLELRGAYLNFVYFAGHYRACLDNAEFFSHFILLLARLLFIIYCLNQLT